MIQNPTFRDLMVQISIYEQRVAQQIGVRPTHTEEGSKFYNNCRATQRTSTVMASSQCTINAMKALFDSCKEVA